MAVLDSGVSAGSPEFTANSEAHLALIAEVEAAAERSVAGGGRKGG